MNLRTYTNSLTRGLAVVLDEIRRSEEGFMNGDIGIFGILDEPFVGKGIATDYQLKTSILKDETDRAVPA